MLILSHEYRFEWLYPNTDVKVLQCFVFVRMYICLICVHGVCLCARVNVDVWYLPLGQRSASGVGACPSSCIRQSLLFANECARPAGLGASGILLSSPPILPQGVLDCGHVLLCPVLWWVLRCYPNAGPEDWRQMPHPPSTLLTSEF